ncbi:MAG: ATP-binding protein [Chloroflexi bacterium]|nr:ATP-binding protein [Chloroflexota bacterium]
MSARLPSAPLERSQSLFVELRIPSVLGWERPVIDLAASVATRIGFPTHRVEDIKMAVAEAVLNAIEHGNKLNESQQVTLILVPGADGLEINVHDQSPFLFTPPASAPSLDEQLAGRLPPRGWGTFLIRSLVDEVEFTSTEAGNAVRMVVHLDRQA